MRCDGLVAEVADWAAGLEEVHARIAGAFTRAEPRARVLAYLRGLLGQLERQNGWTLGAGPAPASAPAPPASTMTSASPPSPSWPAACSPEPWRTACRPTG